MRAIKTEERWIITGLLIAGLVFSIIAVLTHIPAGGADNYAHFNISRWAFRYPYLFLDHWGKPVFTLLTAPVARLGMTWVRIFNVIGGLITAWFIYKLALHFHLRFAWFAVFIAIFTPIYFVLMFSGMTEVLFSLFLVAPIYLFFKKKYLLSAVVISFIFLVRTEGLAFLLLFLMGFIIKKQYKCIPFLFVGFVLFSLIGWVYHFHDFWWLINKRPYATGGPSVYGSGDWYYFIVRMPRYYGYVVPFFLLAGSITLVVRWVKNRLNLLSDDFFLILLILGSFWGYFFIHSYLWWIGETSAGLYRVMGGVSPLAAFISVFFIHSISIKNQGIKFVSGILIVFALFMVVSASAFYHRSVSHDLSAEILDRVTTWLKKPENIRHKMVVHNPYFAFSTGIDAWDTDAIQYGFSNNDSPETGLPDSTLFVWDAHFSANEGGMPLDKIMGNKDFEVVTCFDPVVPFKVLGGNDYKIYVFRKISGAGRDNQALLKKIQQEEMEKGVYYAEMYDFESPFSDSTKESRRVQTNIDSLGFVYNLDGADFSTAFHIPEAEIDRNTLNKLRITADILLHESVQDGKLLMVFSVESDREVFHYATSDISKQNLDYGVWGKAEFIFIVPPEIKKGTLIKSYIWNIEKNNLLLDNFKVEFIRQES
jgi:hypothetical protein